MGVTQEIARFVNKTRARDVPADLVRLAQGFIIDGLGVALAGQVEEGTRIVLNYAQRLGGREEVPVLGTPHKLPVPLAALVNGVSAHAMDYDDTQLSTSKEAVYGLLTHPTTPVLNAALAAGAREQIRGAELLLAYIIGVEVECRIADAINPRHYQSGFHSTATIGGLGAAMAVGKILHLKEESLLRALGVAASMASGLRENFGTMTKPLHAGRAAENGVTAALLAQAGHTAAANILEARRGFFNAMAGGFDESKIAGRLGRPYFMQDPGISIKPYPSGSLSHPAQDLILDLIKKHDLQARDIAKVEVGTNSNVPNALIYPMPKTALEGKFSIPFCMAIAILERKAGIAQFVDKKVRERKAIELMKRVTLYVDDELEKLGYDQVRSKIRIELKNGKTIDGRADIARGHPQNPMSWAELTEKFHDCAALVLPREKADAVIQFISRLPEQPSLAPLLRVLAARDETRLTRIHRRESRSKPWSRTRKQ
jgi:2-methylcitrate dehydratase PrpD